MWFEILMLVISLAIILISCELFTNSIEWFGKMLGVGDGIVGSIFSALGTCLPETLVPIIAILFTKDIAVSEYIGIGAIVGAPFMLSTLAFFITGLSVLIFWKRRKSGFAMKVNNKVLSRDIGFFIIVYGIGIFAAFIDSMLVKYLIAAFLIAAYILYIILTVRQDKVSHNEIEDLYFSKLLKQEPKKFTIIFQICFALTGIIFGANIFVNNITTISNFFGISALALSLVITPVATELPEKFNSIIWISRNKDTLALGNITGAMVFQSCIPVTIGILGTKWLPNEMVIVSASLAMMSALVTYCWIKIKGKAKPNPIVVWGSILCDFHILSVFPRLSIIAAKL